MLSIRFFGSSVVLIVSAIMLHGCVPHGPAQCWLAPDGYRGYLKVDYGVPGTAELPMRSGCLVHRFPLGGHLVTSSVVSALAERALSFGYETPNGVRELEYRPKEATPGLAVQMHKVAVSSAFGNAFFACAFIGTGAELASVLQTCEKAIPSP